MLVFFSLKGSRHMAFVPIPKDLTSVKSKMFGNFTGRQAVCGGLALLIGVPAFVSLRPIVGNDLSIVVVMLIAGPLLFVAQYEKDGMKGEQYLKQMYEVKFKRSSVRKYKNTNFYETINDMAKLERQYETQKAVAIQKKQKSKKKDKKKAVIPEGAD